MSDFAPEVALYAVYIEDDVKTEWMRLGQAQICDDELLGRKVDADDGILAIAKLFGAEGSAAHCDSYIVVPRLSHASTRTAHDNRGMRSWGSVTKRLHKNLWWC